MAATLAAPVDARPQSATKHVALEAALFLVSVLLIYVASPVVHSSDSHFVIPTAISIVRHGDADIDEYSGHVSEAHWAARQINGHWWNVYPIGVPLMTVPAVCIADATGRLFGRDLEAETFREFPGFLEKCIASVFTALAATALFCYFRHRLDFHKSLLLAGLLALGTPAYSTASRGLWQHGPAMLLMATCLLLYDRLSNWKTAGAILLGIAAGYSYSVRPSNSALIFGFAALLWYTHRSRLTAYLAGAAIGVTPLFAFHLTAYGTWSSMYYRMTQGGMFDALLPPKPLAAILFSPSRGLFIFCPFLIGVLVRYWPSFRRQYPLTPLEKLLTLLSIAWIVGTARWFMWWGGGSYGPRLLSEVALFAVVLMVPLVDKLSLSRTRLATAGFLVAGALSVAIHLRGATDPVTLTWPQEPAAERVWLWKEAQFLYGIR